MLQLGAGREGLVGPAFQGADDRPHFAHDVEDVAALHFHAKLVAARADIPRKTFDEAIARESFRVQQTRYSSGATTILDLLEAEVNLSQAEADLVQARYGWRLALSGLETILGKRLFTDKGNQ